MAHRNTCEKCYICGCNTSSSEDPSRSCQCVGHIEETHHDWWKHTFKIDEDGKFWFGEEFAVPDQETALAEYGTGPFEVSGAVQFEMDDSGPNRLDPCLMSGASVTDKIPKPELKPQNQGTAAPAEPDREEMSSSPFEYQRRPWMMANDSAESDREETPSSPFEYQRKPWMTAIDSGNDTSHNTRNQKPTSAKHGINHHQKAPAESNRHHREHHREHHHRDHRQDHRQEQHREPALERNAMDYYVKAAVDPNRKYQEHQKETFENHETFQNHDEGCLAKLGESITDTLTKIKTSSPGRDHPNANNQLDNNSQPGGEQGQQPNSDTRKSPRRRVRHHDIHGDMVFKATQDIKSS